MNVNLLKDQMLCDYIVVFSESIGPGRSGATSRLSAADSHNGDILQQVGVCQGERTQPTSLTLSLSQVVHSARHR
jgi:hypothetical protein